MQDEPSKNKGGKNWRALLASFILVLFICVGSFLGMFAVYKLSLLTGGKPDDPLPLPIVLVFSLAYPFGLFGGSIASVVLWVLVMRLFLYQAEMEKLLNYRNESATMRRLNDRILDWAYKRRR